MNMSRLLFLSIVADGSDDLMKRLRRYWCGMRYRNRAKMMMMMMTTNDIHLDQPRMVNGRVRYESDRDGGNSHNHFSKMIVLADMGCIHSLLVL